MRNIFNLPTSTVRLQLLHYTIIVALVNAAGNSSSVCKSLLSSVLSVIIALRRDYTGSNLISQLELLFMIAHSFIMVKVEH